MGVSKFKLEFQSNLSCFHSGKLADAIADDVWDVANIACEAERSKTIHFSPAYCEIQVIFKGILKTAGMQMSLQRIKASLWDLIIRSDSRRPTSFRQAPQ